MPSYDSAILYINNSDAPVDDGVFLSLKDETCLLVEGVTCAPEQPAPEVRRRPDGKPFLTVYQPADLVWQVEARVLEWSGLADAHPGAALSRRALSFMNGPEWRLPFQFEDDGELVLERPVAGMNPGTLPDYSFAVRLVNGGTLDEEAWPATGTAPVVLTVELPVQSVNPLTVETGETLLEEVFGNANAFAGAAVSAQFYDGDPATVGTAVGTAVETAAWTDIREHNGVYGAEAFCPAFTMSSTAEVERGATHVRLTRNGVLLRDIVLAQRLIIPAYYAVSVPEGALSVWLAWPVDGGAPAENPGAAVLEFLMGGSRAALLPDTDRRLRAWDGDPTNGGTELDAIDLDAGAQFTITGRTVHPGSVTGTNTAPGGGWAVEYITIEITTSGLVVFQQQHTASVSAGNVLTLSDVPVMDLDAT